MGKFFYLTKRCRKIRAKGSRIKFHWNSKIATMVAGVLILITGLVYIIQINNLSIKGYHIKELEQRVEVLQEISQEFEDKILTLQSINEVNERVAKLEMVEAAEVEYLIPEVEEVALTTNYE